MPRTRTLAQLRARARVLADAVTSTNTSDAEANVEVNEAIAELWDMQCKADPTRHMRRIVLTASSGVRSYDFADAAAFSPTAADFMSIVGVKYIGQDNEEEPLSRYDFHDDAPPRFRPMQYPFSSGALVRYDVRYSGATGADARLVFDADPEVGARYAVYYLRAAPSLTLDADAFDGVNGWDEWVALRVAVTIREREETDTSGLERRLAQARERITTMAPQRDAGRSKQVTSVWARAMGHSRRTPRVR